MQELISVIVPIYNVESYLDRCIRSIVNQTYKNLEIILIDDGSPDQCPDICDQWAQRDYRIKVIHKENGGLSDARNAGMKIMTGDYVSFIDSDDWISENMYEIMLYNMQTNNADICESGFKRTSEFNKYEEQNSQGKCKAYAKEEALKALIQENIKPMVWNKLYKRNLIEDNWFRVGKCNEDEFWIYKILDNSKKIIQIDDILYYYFFRENSIINETYALKRLDGLEARYERMKYLEKYPQVYRIAKQQLIFNCMYHYQKGLSYLKGNDLKVLKKKIINIYHDIPIDKEDMLQYSLKEKVWVIFSKISLDLVCHIRNYFGYGVN